MFFVGCTCSLEGGKDSFFSFTLPDRGGFRDVVKIFFLRLFSSFLTFMNECISVFLNGEW